MKKSVLTILTLLFLTTFATAIEYKPGKKHLNKEGVVGYLNKETTSKHISFDPYNSIPITTTIQKWRNKTLSTHHSQRKRWVYTNDLSQRAT